MDQGVLLRVILAALIAVVALWAVREVAGAIYRRRHRGENQTTALGTVVELVPLVTQGIQALSKRFRKRVGPVESLVAEDGTVSLLFSDIEGSTKLNRQLGDEEWVLVLRAHNAIVDDTVEGHGGKVVKTAGDGFMAAFASPEAAVEAAVSLGPRLNASDDVGVALPLRVGVHTGEVVTEAGDLYGTNVVLAARIADKARGDEVLVSDAVRTELDGTESLDFQRRRNFRLKGLPGRHLVHSVTACEPDE